jgi:hypothetical protein
MWSTYPLGNLKFAPEHLLCRCGANEFGETILFCETGDHFRCAMSMLMDENDSSTMPLVLLWQAHAPP